MCDQCAEHGEIWILALESLKSSDVTMHANRSTLTYIMNGAEGRHFIMAQPYHITEFAETSCIKWVFKTISGGRAIDNATRIWAIFGQ